MLVCSFGSLPNRSDVGADFRSIVLPIDVSICHLLIAHFALFPICVGVSPCGGGFGCACLYALAFASAFMVENCPCRLDDLLAGSSALSGLGITLNDASCPTPHANFGIIRPMNIDSLLAISPIDGRYSNKCAELQEIFSEFGLIKRRVLVECT